MALSKEQRAFSFQNIHAMFITPSFVLSVQSSQGYNKPHPFFTLLTDLRPDITILCLKDI